MRRSANVARARRAAMAKARVVGRIARKVAGKVPKKTVVFLTALILADQLWLKKDDGFLGKFRNAIVDIWKYQVSSPKRHFNNQHLPNAAVVASILDDSPLRNFIGFDMVTAKLDLFLDAGASYVFLAECIKRYDAEACVVPHVVDVLNRVGIGMLFEVFGADLSSLLGQKRIEDLVSSPRFVWKADFTIPTEVNVNQASLEQPDWLVDFSRPIEFHPEFVRYAQRFKEMKYWEIAGSDYYEEYRLRYDQIAKKMIDIEKTYANAYSPWDQDNLIDAFEDVFL